ncbi:MAG: hypothetical protein JST40_13320 [Armatimonadetes bacterium]|nr:hypothetical protein [Armatimonadota bacterium]
MKTLCTLALSSVIAATAYCQETVVHSDNFDGFASATLTNQSGWSTDLPTGGTFTVSSTAALGTGKGVLYNTALVSAGTGYAWKDISQILSSQTYVTSFWMKFNPLQTNTSRAGLQSYVVDETSTLTIDQEAYLYADGRLEMWVQTGVAGGYAFVTDTNAPAGVWHRVEMVLDYSKKKSTWSVNGVVIGQQSDIGTGQVTLSDMDLAVSSFGDNVVNFDDYKVTRYDTGQQWVTGRVLPSEYMGTPFANATMTFVPVAGGNPVVQTVALDSDGYFKTQAPTQGTFDVFAKIDGYLSKKLGQVTGDAYSRLSVASLLGGDIDNDDMVTVFDYVILSDAFDTSVGDAGYLPAADLDGDGSVTVFDYLILSNNFDLFGDLQS